MEYFNLNLSPLELVWLQKIFQNQIDSCLNIAFGTHHCLKIHKSIPHIFLPWLKKPLHLRECQHIIYVVFVLSNYDAFVFVSLRIATCWKGCRFPFGCFFYRFRVMIYKPFEKELSYFEHMHFSFVSYRFNDGVLVPFMN